MINWSTNNWMSFIDEDIRINELTIPGTHDSCTYKADQIEGVGFVKCQSLSIREQLNSGCRFLDIRGSKSGDTITMFHGDFYLHLNFNDVIGFCKEFLSSNPTETILMSLKAEHDRDNQFSFEEVVKQYTINQDPNLWYTKNSFPKLKDVRGKIVLLRRFSLDGSNDFGINLTSIPRLGMSTISSELKLMAQDVYDPDNLEEKITAIEEYILNMRVRNPSVLGLCFTSCYTSFPPKTPKSYASDINPWLISSIDIINGQTLGIFALDFISKELTEFFIQDNFQFHMGLETDHGSWKYSYQAMFSFEINKKVYMYAQNLGRNNWFVQELLPGGKMGAETDHGSWKYSYEVQFSFKIDDTVYMYAQNLGRNNWFIQELLPGGKMGKQTDCGSWKYSYEVQFSFKIDDTVYMYAQNLGRNNWFIQELLPGGKMGKQTDCGSWKRPYTTQIPIVDDSKVYFFAYTALYKKWFIQELLPGGKMGVETDHGSWKKSWFIGGFISAANSFQLNEENLLYYQDLNTGIWYIREIGQDGKFLDGVMKGKWKYIYRPQFIYSVQGEKYLYGERLSSFLFGGKWFIQRLIAE